MNFVENQASDDTLDLVCRMCPMHLMEPGDKLKCMKKGQVLEVLTDYDGALEDIPDWCKKCGQEFIGMEEDEDCYKLYIRKTKKCTIENCYFSEFRRQAQILTRLSRVSPRNA